MDMKKPIDTAGHYAGMATAAAGMIATGSAGMGLVGYGLGYGLTKIGKAMKSAPSGRHSALNDQQFGKK
jgi:hypothetical protein